MKLTPTALLLVWLGSCAAPAETRNAPGETPSSDELAAAPVPAAAPETRAEPESSDAARPIAPQPGLTQAAALELAAANRPELEAARARVRAAGGRLKAAGRLPNPGLYVLGEQVPLDSGELDTAQYLLGVTQTVPIGGRLRRAEDAAERDLEAAAADVLAVARLVRREVLGAFVTALYARDAVALTGEAANIAQEELSIVSSRQELGDAVPSEVAGSALALARAQAEERRAAALEASARLALSASIGGLESGPADRVTVEGELDRSLALPELEFLLARIDQDPSLIAAGARSEAAAARVEVARAQRVPDLRFDLAYRRLELTQQDTYDIGVGIDVPLFDSGSARVESSRAQLIEARATERGTRLRAETEVRDAYVDATQALEVLRFQQEEVLPRTRVWIENVRTRHEVGDIGTLEFLRARRLEVELAFETLEAQRDLMAAWARLAAYLEP